MRALAAPNARLTDNLRRIHRQSIELSVDADDRPFTIAKERGRVGLPQFLKNLISDDVANTVRCDRVICPWKRDTQLEACVADGYAPQPPHHTSAGPPSARIAILSTQPFVRVDEGLPRRRMQDQPGRLRRVVTAKAEERRPNDRAIEHQEPAWQKLFAKSEWMAPAILAVIVPENDAIADVILYRQVDAHPQRGGFSDPKPGGEHEAVEHRDYDKSTLIASQRTLQRHEWQNL